MNKHYVITQAKQQMLSANKSPTTNRVLAKDRFIEQLNYFKEAACCLTLTTIVEPSKIV